MSKDALIVVDVQNDFITGTLAVPGAERVAQDIRNYLEDCATTYDYIVATQDWHIAPGDHWSDTPDFVNSWPKHCEAKTWGAGLQIQLSDTVDEVFRKGKFSAAYSGFEGISMRHDDVTNRLDHWLLQREVSAVDVLGLATDHCVKATVLDARSLGLHTTVLLNYCAAVSAESERRAIEEMRRAGAVMSE